VGHRASSFPKYFTPAFSRGLHYFVYKIHADLAMLQAMILRRDHDAAFTPRNAANSVIAIALG